MKQLFKALLAGILIGAIVALLYLGFTHFVEEAQQFIWFDIADADENKIMAIPVALIGGLIMAFVLHKIKALKPNSLEHASIDGFSEKLMRVDTLSMILLVGFISLVAGASLGPEAILLPVSYGVGYLVAGFLKNNSAKKLGVVGVVALLAAFMNSAYALLLILGIVFKDSKKAEKPEVLYQLLVGVVSIVVVLATLRSLGHDTGYIVIQQVLSEMVIKPGYLLLAMLVAIVAMAIPYLIIKLAGYFQNIYKILGNNWIMLGLISGLGIGALYALMGPTSYFSGSYGLPKLFAENGELTSFQLAGLFFGKLVVTAWSLATIYRGGIVFPQLLIVSSMALLFSGASPNESWLATLLVGGIFGVFAGSLGSLFIAIAFVLALFGANALPLVFAATLGIIAVKVIRRNKNSSSIA